MSETKSTLSAEGTTGSQSAVDKLVQQIKAYIHSNRLTVGDGLPSEREMGEMFKAARNTVREAFRILKAYGVVDIRPKVGAVIVNRHMDAALDLFSFQLTVSREIFLDIQGFRKLIEVGLVDSIFERITDTDIGELTRINTAILTSTSAEEAAQFDFDFHAVLLNVSGNKTVLDVYKTMKPIITRLQETGKVANGLDKTYDHHSKILDAVIRRDRLAYQYLMSHHLDHGLKLIEQSVEENKK